MGRRKLFFAFALVAVICATVMADTVDFTFNNTVGDGIIVPGDGVVFTTIDDGNAPFPIMQDLQIRTVDDDVEGAWGSYPFETNFAFAGEYEAMVLVSYMDAPSKPVGPKKVSVAKPDKVQLAKPSDWTGTNLAINTEYNVKFRIMAQGKAANLDLATTQAEERITYYSLATGEPTETTPWGSGEFFAYVGDGDGIIKDIKNVEVPPDDFASIPLNAVFSRVKQEIQVTYLRGDGTRVTSPVLGSFDIKRKKTGPGAYTMIITQLP
jgi:hypothetical protein